LLGEEDTAASFSRKILASISVEDGEEQSQDLNQTMVDALIFLARYCFQKGLHAEARQHCERLLDCPVPERDDARAILSQIQAAAVKTENSQGEDADDRSRSPALAKVDFNAHGGLEGTTMAAVAGGKPTPRARTEAEALY